MVPNPSLQHAVGELYLQHHNWVVQLLRRKLGNQDQAMDLAQDTFVRILRSERLPVLREPRAYLNTVASRLCGQYFRRQALERAYLETLAQLEPQYQPRRKPGCWCLRPWTPWARCWTAWAAGCARCFCCPSSKA